MGFQYMRKMECLESWEYRVERDVTTSMLEEKGMTAAYIDKIRPVAMVRSALHVVKANGETCGSGNSECGTGWRDLSVDCNYR